MDTKGRQKANRCIAFFALVLLLAGLGAVSLRAQEKHETLNPKQLEALIANAKTPADHEKIAAYYRQEAARLKNDAEMHRVDAGIYGKGPGLLHCTNLARLDEEAAKEASSLAAMHEKMAKEAKK